MMMKAMMEEQRMPLHSLVKRWVLCVLATFAICLPHMACAQVFLSKQPPEDWDMEHTLQWTIFDVNEGDAMLLTCEGESMMVDGGPNPFREDLQQALDERGLRHMKYFLNTHYHDDHIDGLYQLLLNGFTADAYLHSYNDWAIRNSELGERTVKAAQKANVPVERILEGDTLSLGGAAIQVHQCTEFTNTNARALMLKVTYGESSILLCSDIIGRAQHYFLENLPAQELKADLIKLPHHAITPTVPAFLDAVAPEAAVATNRQKDLDGKSINQLKSRDLPTFFSGDGTVYAVTDGTDWYLWQTEGTF